MIATLCLASMFSFVSTSASLAPHPPSKTQWKKLKEGQVRPMLRSNEKICFTRQKTAETKRRLCKISAQPRTLMMLCIQLLFKENKRQNNTKPLQTDS